MNYNDRRRDVVFNPIFLRENYPFVLSFRNIVDYIKWSNPIIRTGEREVNKGKRVWRKIFNIFHREGWIANTVETPTFMLGGVYDTDYWLYQLHSDSEVKIPLKPEYMYLITDDKIYVLRITNKRRYVEILKNLVNAVIVRI